MKKFLLLFCFLFLSACVSGSLRSHPEFEEYPLRPASGEEAKELKRCLRASHAAMERIRKKTKRYPRKASELPVDDVCQSFSLAIQPIEGGYEVVAQFNENEQTVRWSINHDAVIEEHEGGEGEMDDLEL